MTNSLISDKKNKLNQDFKNLKNIDILNHSSIDLSQLRNSMVFSGLDVLKYNINRKKNNLKLFEVGKEYYKGDEGKYIEAEKLALFIYGLKVNNHWNINEKKSDYFFLKGIIKSITDRLGFGNVKFKPKTTDNISEGETIFYNKSEILSFGLINKDICEYFDINENVLYAEIDVKAALDKYSIKPVQFKSISKFPEVSRDLSILIDHDLNFDKIYKATKQIDQKLIKDVSLFDVYEGKNLPKNKKSYGISFKIQDNNKTLSETEIEEVMGKIISRLKKEFNVELR